MKANSHFGILRYPLIMYTILFTYVAHHNTRTTKRTDPNTFEVLLGFLYFDQFISEKILVSAF